MAAVTSIVLNDAQVAPVAHTFVPTGPDDKGIWWFEDQSTASAIGYNKISISLVKPPRATPGTVSSSQRRNRVQIGIWTPKLETLGNNSAGYVSAPTVAYVPSVTIQMDLPERSTRQDRRDLRGYTTSLLSDPLVCDAVDDLRNMY